MWGFALEMGQGLREFCDGRDRINMKRAVRLNLAFLLAPAISVFAYYILFLRVPFVLVVDFSILYGIAVIVVVPLFLFFYLRKKGKITSYDCISGGLFAGIIFPLGLMAVFLVWDIVTAQPIGPLSFGLLVQLGIVAPTMFGVFGAIAGDVFALLAGFKSVGLSRSLHDR